MNNELKAPYDVVIVGSGYSGTMVAVHLARRNVVYASR